MSAQAESHPDVSALAIGGGESRVPLPTAAPAGATRVGP